MLGLHTCIFVSLVTTISYYYYYHTVQFHLSKERKVECSKTKFTWELNTIIIIELLLCSVGL